jgi:2-polyprenyl-3-methyl-5-hydroxy-6-metoxy-1,4-benzoquinol methylase
VLIISVFMNNSEQALKDAYQALKPYSNKYRVDFRRYLFSMEIITNIAGAREKTFLDVGTGAGIMPIALRKLGIEADGLEYYIFPESGNKMFAFDNIEKLQAIWQRHGVEVYKADFFGKDLLKKVPAHDIILSEAMIEHVKDPKAFLNTCKNLLKPGGYLLLTTPNLATLLKRLRFLLGLSPNWPIEEFFNEGENFTGHWREYTARELSFMCEASGFSIVSQHNKNLITEFKNLRSWRKNLRALVTLLSSPIPDAREMHYLLAQKS